MRRNNRKPNILDDDANLKIIKIASIGVGVLAIIVIGILLYSKNLNDKVREETLDSEQMAKILENSQDNMNTQSASTEIGKSVNEAANELNSASNQTNTIANNNTVNSNNTNTENSIANTSNTANAGNSTNSTNTSNQNTNQETSNLDLAKQNTENEVNGTNNESSNSKESETKTKTDTTSKELSFEKPVEGDIIREFAKDNLVYSQTLEEWTTHNGIDIKADKTTVVKSAETGTVKSIKNDPRYGLTVVIEHANGFQTVYSNLLTSEFVVEGEVVEKGQSIGTVGNTAAFEIADEPHLHFEIIKDGTRS